MLYSQNEWIEFTTSEPKGPVIDLLSSDNSSVEADIEVCGMFKMDTIVNSQLYNRIKIPGYSSSTSIGEPEIPIVTLMIAIPECSDITFNIDVTDQLTLNDYYIYPVPDYIEDSLSYPIESFVKDTIRYETNEFYPLISGEISSKGYLRAQKYAEVSLYPVQFNPVLHQLIINVKYAISLEFINPTTAVNVNTGIFNNIASHIMINYVSSGISAIINDRPGYSGNVEWITMNSPNDANAIVADYLIITDEEFFNPHNPDLLLLANHRANYNGFDVAIINVENIKGLNFEYTDPLYIDEQKIRSCIRRVWDGMHAAHTYDNHLGYVLLIGDTHKEINDHMSTSYDHIVNYGGDKYPSDYYFSCVTEDDDEYDRIGDLYIGRLCISNTENPISPYEKLHNIVAKTIYFESEASFTPWRNRIFFTNDCDLDDEYFNTKYYNWIDDHIPDQYDLGIVNCYQIGAIGPPTFDNIDMGGSIITYCGHGAPNGWDAIELENTYLMNNLSNNHKTPIAYSFACSTGKFDSNEEIDCMAEYLITYSEEKGFVGFLGAGRDWFTGWHVNIYDPPRHIWESIPYSIWHDYSFISGEALLEGELYIINSDDRFKYNYFGDPALNIFALGFEITVNTTLPPIVTISTDITVRSGVTLTIPPEGEIFFENNGKLIIQQGATLIISPNVVIHGINLQNKIELLGDLNTIGNNAILTAPISNKWSGIVVNNESNDYEFPGYTFERCPLTGLSNSIELAHCDFTDSYLRFTKGDVTITYSNFLNSDIQISNPNSQDRFINIQNCVLQENADSKSIIIEQYPLFVIDNNLIQFEKGSGIALFNAGSSVGFNHLISNNTIYFEGNQPGISYGIKNYHSYSIIYDNHIQGASYGLVSLDRSDLSLSGNQNANEEIETQQIINNRTNQVYTVPGSFPYEFEWNAIYNNSGNYPLVYYDVPVIPTYRFLDVNNNYWTDDFNPTEDLYPEQIYIYDEIWEPHWGSHKNINTAQELFYAAKQAIIDGDYAEAESNFRQIIENYSESQYLQASVKELLMLKRIYDQDFTGLKNYLDTVPTLQQDSATMNLTAHVANWCNIENEDYITAVNWFETQIDNPPSFEDSIFAIIDLGYTYLLMDSTDDRYSSFIGRYPEYKPTSHKVYEINREDLIDLLFKHSNNQQQNQTISENDTTIFSLIQNFPNPFKKSTDIIFSIPKAAWVSVKVYNMLGALVATPYNEYTGSGEHRVTFTPKNLTEGIYYCIIEVNRGQRDVKKMILLK